MGLQPSAAEIAYLHKNAVERYVLKNPAILYKPWTNLPEQDDKWGRVVTKTYSTSISVNADYNWDKKLKEFTGGVWITTNKIELTICKKQLDDLSITPKVGDVLFLMNQSHEVLNVQPTNLIVGTQYDYLYYLFVIDTKQTIES